MTYFTDLLVNVQVNILVYGCQCVVVHDHLANIKKQITMDCFYIVKVKWSKAIYKWMDGMESLNANMYLMQSGANRLKYFADQIIFKKIELINYSNLELLLSYPK